MPLLTRSSTRTFHRNLYAGWSMPITLVKRGGIAFNLSGNLDASGYGVQTSYSLFNCRRKKVEHEGQPLLSVVASADRVIFQIPAIQLEAAGLTGYVINPLDRIIDEDGYVWQPEADTLILIQLGGNFVNVFCKRLPNQSA